MPIEPARQPLSSATQAFLTVLERETRRLDAFWTTAGVDAGADAGSYA